jgi:hypothetical protein
LIEMSAYIVGGHLHGKQQVVNLVSDQDIDVNTMRALVEGIKGRVKSPIFCTSPPPNLPHQGGGTNSELQVTLAISPIG